MKINCRYILVFIMLLVLSPHLFSQPDYIDSLKKVLKVSTNDTSTCKILNELVENADEEEWPAYNLQLKLLTERKLKTNISPIEKDFYTKYYGQTIHNLGIIAQEEGKYKEAVELYKTAIKLFIQINDLEDEAKTMCDIGNCYAQNNDIVSAIEYYNQSITLNKKIGNKSVISRSLNDLATLYNSQGDVAKALEMFSESLLISERLNDKNAIASTLNNIALIYRTQDEKEKAIEYFQKALNIAGQLKKKDLIASILNNLGAVYIKTNDSKKGFLCYQKCLQINQQLHDTDGISVCLINIGSAYRTIGLLDKALSNLNESLLLSEKIHNKRSYTHALNSISEILIQKGNIKQAEEYSQKAYKIALEIGSPKIIQLSAHNLKLIYKNQNKFKEAFDMFELELKMKDSIYNTENKKAAIRNQIQYTYKKKEIEAQAEQNKKEAIANEKKKRQDIITYSVCGILALVLILTFYIFKSYREKHAANEIITKQKLEVENQKSIIEEKHQEIKDSINYAERIQRSFLATKEILDEHLKDYFVLFQPKDVVSGDFYWAANLINGDFALVTADSTGHGVPGAIMSLLNVTSLERAIENESEPSQILNATRKIIIDRLKKDGSPEGGKDGMDCSLISFDFKHRKLLIAAANNPVWIVRGLETIEILPDKMPVGKHDKDQFSFTQKEIDLQKGDVIYTLTDGFSDQFGGESGKKFMSKNLRELLTKNAHLPMKNQKQILETTLKGWIGNLEQVDDITIIGVRV